MLQLAYRNGLEVLKQACMDGLKKLPFDRRFKTEDIARLDKDLLVEFLTHVRSSFSLFPRHAILTAFPLWIVQITGSMELNNTGFKWN